ncbi:MAG: phosphate transporter [Bacteroidetes bacterium GWF2_38_335]|nr:MAG: phosphate transporter [Bacteroidetes bacterium GWF2_38_335]OFY81414.1 MAG: phosphate transporter [Bacteroidetes bacterium RIFOXYA12_FULL_38_20]HBS85540.1 inorganic phosphate transporter [Bacteroidales bacterium]
MLTFLIIVIALALIFDFINGFHDAANSIATIVSTKVLTPVQAVIWAAFFNFVAFFIFKDHGVANTVAKTVKEDYITLYVVVAGLIGAIAWNLFTWWKGIPSSSSHTLIGGFAGAAIAHAGLNSIDPTPVLKTAAFIVVAPLAGLILAYLTSIWFLFSFKKGMLPKLISISIIAGVFIFFAFILEFQSYRLGHRYDNYFGNFLLYSKNFKWILLGFILLIMATFTLFLSSLNVARSNFWFRKLQLVSSAAFSIGHGGNDAQKVMGIITVALIAGGQISSFEEMPDWVPIACYTAIAAGTLSGGWKIVKTMGTKITKVTPFEGVAAETAGAMALFLSENLKIPVSTTHTITGSIIGVGATKSLSAVKWGVTINLLWAWILTIPVSALIAMLVYVIIKYGALIFMGMEI